MAGVAIGLGNVWRFPYMVGAHGGGAFLVVFLLLVVLFGVPCVMAEWTLGRHTRRGPLEAFRRAGMPGGETLGLVLVICLLLAVSYYTVIVARVAWYCLDSPRGAAVGPAAPAYYAALQGDLTRELGMTAVLLAAMGAVLLLGVRRGIERASRIAMPALAALLLLLLLRTLSLPGAWEAALEVLRPRLDDLRPSTFLAAMGQVFFSLSLGGTFFLIYGSYLRDDQDIPGGAAATALADTAVAFLAVCIVLPAAAVFGVAADQGPSLLFVTLPQVFGRMPAGLWFAAAFFLALLLAAFLSAVAGLEVVASGVVDRFGWSRRITVLAILGIELGLAIPASLSDAYIARADLIFGSTMQPIGSFLALMALGWFVGRGRALAEVNRGASVPVGGLWILWIRFVIPVLVLAILVWGWWG